MEDKRVHSKSNDKESMKNIFGIFQIIFEYYHSVTTASLIFLIFLVNFNETSGLIAMNNIFMSCTELTISENDCIKFKRYEINTDHIRNESVIMEIKMKKKQFFENKQNESITFGSNTDNYSATKGGHLGINVTTTTQATKTLTTNLQYNVAIKLDHLYELKLYKKNNYLNKQKLTEITQNRKQITSRGIGSVVENKKNDTDRNLVTAKWNLKAVNSITSLQVKQTLFERKHVRLPRKINQVLISTNSKYEYYSKILNYTYKDRKLRNNTKLKMRRNATYRLIGKYVRNIKVTKNKKATERVLNTTYDTVYFYKEQDRTLYKRTIMKRKYQNENRINRTNYIKSLRKQIKSDILMNPNIYGILPYFDKASFGVTLLKNKLKKIISTKKISDKSNSSTINVKSSTARRIVTTYKSKHEYYATLGRKLMEDYFTTPIITTVSINLKGPDKYDDDDDEEDMDRSYAAYLYKIAYNPISSYNMFWNNYSNDVYQFTHAITSWNNINNIIAIHLHTSPPTTQRVITCFVHCILQTMSSICPTRKRRVRILREDFALPKDTVFEMVWLGLLMVFLVIFCCGTPIFLIEQVKKKKVPPSIDES